MGKEIDVVASSYHFGLAQKQSVDLKLTLEYVLRLILTWKLSMFFLLCSGKARNLSLCGKSRQCLLSPHLTSQKLRQFCQVNKLHHELVLHHHPNVTRIA